MNLFVDEINSFIGELKKLEEEETLIEKRRKAVQKQIITAFSETLNEINRNWRPKVDERVIMVDLRRFPPYATEVIIRKVHGNHCSIANTLLPTNMFTGFFLDQDINEYGSPFFTLPINEYLKLKEKLNLPDYEPIYGQSSK